MFYSRAPLFVLFLFFFSFTSAQSYWKSQWVTLQANVKTLKTDEGRRWIVDIDLLKKALSPKEKTTILLPHPNWELISFDLKEEKVMAKELADKYHNIRAFSGQASSNKQQSIRLELNSQQIFAVVKKGGEEWYVEPDPNNDSFIISYDAQNRIIPEASSVQCETKEKSIEDVIRAQENALSFGSSLRNAKVTLKKYRFALSCTAEYAKSKGGTIESVLTSFVTSVNRMNQILLREAAVQLELIAKNDSLIFFDAEKDPFPEPSNLPQLLNQNGAVINSMVGANSYDIGHIFTSGCSGGVVGIDTLGNVCSSGKARGVTCNYSSNLLSITLNVFAHELGASIFLRSLI